ncbi:asparaginase domain-containing protein [Chitinimonas lacunae]|uniref:Asparaginase domain-containing protein n=1 Tax=Chitinimonas lacunae TaxID=1963018 RepID=A0ABV8MLN1_9NEIS
MAHRRLFVIYAGGTIGMQKTAAGHAPAAGYLPTELAAIARRTPGFPDYLLKEYSPLIDSSNLQPAHWNQIVEDIANHYHDFDGFVVIHGTDTLAYTASALSFMLENLAKPVIVTGAMVSLAEQPNDAEQNLVDAFYWAGRSTLHEVCIAFNRQLLRGNRARKLWGADMGAFGSPNYPILGRFQGEAELNAALCLPPPSQPFRAHRIDPELAIAGLKLYPGHSTRMLAAALATPLRGALVESYGAGNAPDADQALMAAFAEATARGCVLVNCTQCISGKVEMSQYAAGSALARAGLISGLDMTPEAVLTKLYFVLSQPAGLLNPEDLLTTNLRGELSA